MQPVGKCGQFIQSHRITEQDYVNAHRDISYRFPDKK